LPPVGTPARKDPPGAPTATTWTLVTPGGTVKVCSCPVKPNTTVCVVVSAADEDAPKAASATAAAIPSSGPRRVPVVIRGRKARASRIERDAIERPFVEARAARYSSDRRARTPCLSPAYHVSDPTAITRTNDVGLDEKQHFFGVQTRLCLLASSGVEGTVFEPNGPRADRAVPSSAPGDIASSAAAPLQESASPEAASRVRFPVAVFALIHGVCVGAWAWDRVVPYLERAGHAAIAIDLPGDDPAAKFSDYADIVVGALARGEG
jgi:hypothetical protein